MDEITLRALAASSMLAATLGPLGSLVVWRRMAYFGDTIAHAALLGVALSLITGFLPLTLSMFLVAVVVALLLSRAGRDARFHSDTLLGLLAHGTLALGLLLVGMSHSIRVDMNAYLFGDVLVERDGVTEGAAARMRCGRQETHVGRVPAVDVGVRDAAEDAEILPVRLEVLQVGRRHVVAAGAGGKELVAEEAEIVADG